MNSNIVKAVRKIVLSVLAVLVVGVVFAEEGDPLGYALLIQQSPPDAGLVTPGAGVHKVGIGQSVALSATPKPGYRFLYWLGDVSSVSASDTSVSLDSPKMVVAVFGREAFDEDLPQAGLIKGGQGGTSGLVGSANPLTGAASVSPATSPGGDQIINYPDFEDDDDDEILVPGGNEVPEPATVILLGLGMTALLRKKR